MKERIITILVVSLICIAAAVFFFLSRDELLKDDSDLTPHADKIPEQLAEPLIAFGAIEFSIASDEEKRDF